MAINLKYEKQMLIAILHPKFASQTAKDCHQIGCEIKKSNQTYTHTTVVTDNCEIWLHYMFTKKMFCLLSLSFYTCEQCNCRSLLFYQRKVKNVTIHIIFLTFL